MKYLSLILISISFVFFDSSVHLIDELNSLGIGYNQTRSCSKYEEAVNAIREEQFDIFLVDMKLVFFAGALLTGV